VVDWLRSGATLAGRYGLSGIWGLCRAAGSRCQRAYCWWPTTWPALAARSTTGYHFESGEGFTTPIWQGLWGLLFSPYRSVFLHTPLFVASVLAFVPFYRRHRSEALAIAALSLALV
jgi:hypothetical protein